MEAPRADIRMAGHRDGRNTREAASVTATAARISMEKGDTSTKEWKNPDDAVALRRRLGNSPNTENVRQPVFARQMQLPPKTKEQALGLLVLAHCPPADHPGVTNQNKGVGPEEATMPPHRFSSDELDDEGGWSKRRSVSTAHCERRLKNPHLRRTCPTIGCWCPFSVVTLTPIGRLPDGREHTNSRYFNRALSPTSTPCADTGLSAPRNCDRIAV